MAKNIAGTVRIQLDGRHLLFEEYLQNWTAPFISPTLADKHAIKDKLNVNGSKHVLACFITRNYFEWIIKQLLNLAFLSSEE